MKVKFLLCAMFVFGVACSREKGQTSKLVFEIPAVQQKASDFLLLNVEEIGDEFEFYDEDWSTVVPSGIDVGDFSINCYAVMVGGPDASFKDNMCGRKNVNDEDIIDPLFYFGPWVGAVYAETSATQIQMEVPAGSDRVFYLIGFHALDKKACVDFKTGNPSQALLTRPYIIGEVGRVNLEPGDTKTLLMSRSFDSEKWFDECKFKDPSGEAGEYAATEIGISKLTRPDLSILGSDGATDSCVPFMARLLDEYSNPSRSLSEVEVTLKHCKDTVDSPNCHTGDDAALTPYKTHKSYADCIAADDDTDGDSTFKIPQGQRDQLVWVRAPEIANRHIFLKAFTADTSFKMTKKPKKWLVREATDSFINIDGPRRIVSDRCYKYTVNHRKHDGSTSGLIQLAFVKLISIDAAGNETHINSGGYGIFSSDSCTTSFTVSGTPQNSQDVYVKAPVSYSLKIVAEDVSPSTIDSAREPIEAKAGTLTPRRLRVLMPPAIKNGICMGPYYVHLVNEYRSTVPWATNSTKNLFLTPVSAQDPDLDTTGLTIYSSAGCSAGAIGVTAGTGLNLNYLEYGAQFFIKSTNAGESYRRLEFTDGTGLKGRAELRTF